MDNGFVFKILKVNNESKTHIFKINLTIKKKKILHNNKNRGERRDVRRPPPVAATARMPAHTPAWQHRRRGAPNRMEGHLETPGVSRGLTRPPGQEELSPGLPRVPPARPLLKGPVALAS